jgi:hypothetical protein
MAGYSEHECRQRFYQACEKLGKLLPDRNDEQAKVTDYCIKLRNLLRKDCGPLILFQDQERLGRIAHSKIHLPDDVPHQSIDDYVTEGTLLIRQYLKRDVPFDAIPEDYSVLIYHDGLSKPELITPTAIVSCFHEHQCTLFVQHHDGMFYAICPESGKFAQDLECRAEMLGHLRGNEPKIG